MYIHIHIPHTRQGPADAPVEIQGVTYTWTNGTVENRSPNVTVCSVAFDSEVRVWYRVSLRYARVHGWKDGWMDAHQPLPLL